MTVASLRRFADSIPGRVLIECAIVLAVLIAAADWGRSYWNRSLALGRHPFFYQMYYEPAVMVACGKGFVVAQPQVPAMVRFLHQQTQEFDCQDIPADAKLGRDGLYQGASRYLMTAVGLTWRRVGVSWRRLGPVAGALFGIAIAAAYGIFRLGAGRVVAVLLAWMLSVSPLQLLNLPHIRDYSKAPFALLLIFFLGLLVTRRPTWKSVLAVAAACGVVAGIGYGFRTDLLVAIPAFVATVFLFLDARVGARLKYGVAASAVFLAVFAATAWPVLTMVNDTSRCQWHIAALGLGEDATRGLQLTTMPYDWLDGYTDEFVYATATSHAARVQPDVRHIEFCTAQYDDATRTFMFDILRRTPADFIVRAYASSLQMVQLPLRWRKAPMPHVAVDYYRIRSAVTSRVKNAGLPLVAAAVFLVTASSVRLGLFLIGFLLYFGGYPAVQFGNRHFFHLEVITWWAIGFLLQQLVTTIVARVRKRPLPLPPARAVRRAALVMAGCVAGLWVALLGARRYQAPALASLMQQYAKVQVEPVRTDAVGGLHRVPPASHTQTDPERADLLEVDLNEWQCPAKAILTFVYDRSHLGFARDVEIQRGLPHVASRVFLPVYATFRGVSIPGAAPGCLAGVYRVRHAEQFSLMPKVVLRPGWDDRPLHQSLVGWGLEPPPDE